MHSTYRRPLGKDKPCLDSWKAPEHYRGTSDMPRDMRQWLYDGVGGRELNPDKHKLILDKRPVILIPERKTYSPGL